LRYPHVALPSLFHQLAREVRFSWRRLRAAPVFTVFAVASLSLGVGVTSAIFSAVQSVIWQPIDVPNADEIAVLIAATPYGTQPTWRPSDVSRPDFDDARASATSFSSLAATALQTLAMTGDGIASVPVVETVSGSYFDTVRVGAAMGRVLQVADDQPTAPAVVVLGYRFWQTTFASDPNVVGRVVRIAGRPFEIVGVAAESFGGMTRTLTAKTQAWIPLEAAAPLAQPPAISMTEAVRRNRPQVGVIGRLAAGRSLQSAAAELATISARLDRSWPLTRRLPNGNTTSFARAWTVKPASDLNQEAINTQVQVTAIVVGLVALVLVVACTNLANLVLGRGASRQHEFAVRRALGASRGRLVREQLIESAMLGALGAFLVIRVLLVPLAVDVPVAQTLVVHLTPTLNGSMVIVALIAMVASLAVFGLAPALQLSLVDVRSALATESGAASPRWRTRRYLISWQVGISAAFFMVAAFGAEVIVAQARHDSGIDVDRLALGFVDFRNAPWTEGRARVAIDTILRQATQQPGIEGIAVASGLPYGTRLGSNINVTTIDKPFSSSERGDFDELIAATPTIFHTLGVPIVRGRAFTDRDDAAAPPVMVVSEEMAREMFGTTDVVGRQLLARRAYVAKDGSVTTTIVGVARDTDTTFLFNRRGGVAYMPLAQHYETLLVVVGKAARDPAPIVATLERVVSQADPDLALTRAGTGTLVLTGLYALVRILAVLSAGLAALAMVLSMAGLYGVLTHVVARRTREIGVRVALGADVGRIRRLVIADGMRPVAAGLAIGLTLGVLARLAIRAVYRLPLGPMDALAMAVALVPLIAAALVASYLPARRASSVAPNVALREQ
jgi:putative ABC transport system permease protein